MFDGDPKGNDVSYRSRGIITQVATDDWQVAAYHMLRNEVFVEEQRLFSEHDGDLHDEEALPIVAMSVCHGMPDQVVGTVRIFRKPAEGPHVWFGGRLAVDARYRRHGLIGESLIRAAVCTAHALGCQRFLATVQLPVVRYFERHHFKVVDEVIVCGVPHALMEASLTAYPARHFGQQPTLLWADAARVTRVRALVGRAA